MSKEVPSFETDELSLSTFEVDAQTLEKVSEIEAREILDDKRLLGNYVTPFGVRLAENVSLRRVTIDQSSATSTVSYTGAGNNRDYQHDRD